MTSRTCKWENMAVLRPFDDRIFNSKPDPRLMKYDVYLEEQDRKTQYRYETEDQRR